MWFERTGGLECPWRESGPFQIWLPPSLELASVGNVLSQVGVDPSKEWRESGEGTAWMWCPGLGINKTL